MSGERAWPNPRYSVRLALRVPLGYAYRWCTDFRPDDALREGMAFERRILRRSARRVVFEDLWWKPDGWRWRRHEVTLFPPDRWHSDSVGNERDAANDYCLTAVSDDRTRLEIRVRRRPASRAPAQPSKRSFEAELLKEWRGFARALEMDFAAVSRRRSSKPCSPFLKTVGRRDRGSDV
jgi:hypothetical protein